MPGENIHITPPVSSLGSEYHSRCGVLDHGGPVQLEIESELILFGGSICLLTNSSGPSLFQLAARSLCSTDGRLSAGLVTENEL